MFVDSVNVNFNHCNVSLSEVVCRIIWKDILFDLISESDDNDVILIHSPNLVSITLYYNSDADNIIKITPQVNCKSIKSEYFGEYKEIVIESKKSDKYKITNGYNNSLSEFKFFITKDGDWVWLASILVNIK